MYIPIGKCKCMLVINNTCTCDVHTADFLIEGKNLGVERSRSSDCPGSRRGHYTMRENGISVFKNSTL